MAVQGSVRCCIALLSTALRASSRRALPSNVVSISLYPISLHGFLVAPFGGRGESDSREVRGGTDGETDPPFSTVMVTCPPLAQHNLKPNAKMESTSSNATQFRQRQWMYLGPIAATPLAHISVTLYRDAKTQKQRQLILGVGIIGSTVMTLGMRLYLLSHSGYPGQDNSDVIQSRIVEAKTEEERRAITDPSMGRIMKDMMRGFG